MKHSNSLFFCSLVIDLTLGICDLILSGNHHPTRQLPDCRTKAGAGTCGRAPLAHGGCRLRLTSELREDLPILISTCGGDVGL